jgi:hypothetical protein
LTFFENSSTIEQKDGKDADLRNWNLYFFVHLVVVLSVLKKQNDLNFLKRWLIDKVSDVLFEFVTVPPLIVGPNLPKSFHFEVSLASIVDDLVRIHLSFQFLENEHKPVCEKFDFLLLLFNQNEEVNTSVEASAVV